MIERPWWQKAIYQIWPTIYRLINETAFFIMMVVRTTVKLAIRQIKQL